MNLLNINFFKLNSNRIFSLIFLLFLFSLNSKTVLLNGINIIELVNFIRLWLPIIFLGYFLFKFKMINFKEDRILTLIFIIYIFQLVGFINLNIFQHEAFIGINNNDQLINNGYTINNVFALVHILLPLTLLLYFITFSTHIKFNVKGILYLMLFFIGIIGTVSLIKTYLVYLGEDKDIFFYSMDYLYKGDFFKTPSLRSTGLSRVFLILSIFFISYLVIGIKKNLKIISFLCFGICGVIIFMLQSRINIYFFILISFLIFFQKQNFLKNILTFIIFFIFIFFCSKLIINSKENVKHLFNKYSYFQVYQNNNDNAIDLKAILNDNKLFESLDLDIEDIDIDNIKIVLDLDLKKKIIIGKKEIIIEKNKVMGDDITEIKVIQDGKEIFKKKEIILNQNILNNDDLFKKSRFLKSKENDFGSGRTNIWKKIFHYSSKKNSIFLFGLGPLADRYMAQENASSAIMYQLASSGIVGVILLIILYLVVFLKVIKILFFKFKYKKKINHLELFSNISIFYLFFRSLVENSFTNYNIDLFIILVCYQVIASHYKSMVLK